ncbi:unnamed protein product [Somion occarium]|uniref:Protein kinase domain-containing protein n=1 Tax=Somion occarium TaxID=3059160 RepID=A0ABP1DRC9_9APHY
MAPQSRSLPDMTRELVGMDNGRPFIMLNHLGTGGYGAVYRARYLTQSRATGIVAVKVMRQAPSHTRLDAMHCREVMNHKKVSAHPNVVNFRGIVPNRADYLYIIMDFCPGGTLFNLVSATHIFARNDALVKDMFTQLCSAVEFCHANDVFHRDLKPENVLINAECTQVYLTDFGLSTTLEESKTFKLGSKHYMSPECINKEGLAESYSCRRSDIWALGIILLNMVSGRCPWSEASLEDACFKLYMRNRNFLREQLPISKSLNNILHKIFTPNPSMSIGLKELSRLVMQADTLFMTEKEVANGPSAVQDSAKYLVRDPAEPLIPVPERLVSEGLPLWVFPPSGSDSWSTSSSNSDSATNSDADWEDSVPGLRMRRIIPLITDPDLHDGQVAWRRDKTAAAHLERPEMESRSPSAPTTIHIALPSSKKASPGVNARVSSSSRGLSTSSSSSSNHDTTSGSSNSSRSQGYRTLTHEIVVPSSSKPWMRLARRMRRLIGQMA